MINDGTIHSAVGQPGLITSGRPGKPDIEARRPVAGERKRLRKGVSGVDPYKQKSGGANKILYLTLLYRIVV